MRAKPTNQHDLHISMPACVEFAADTHYQGHGFKPVELISAYL